MASADYPSVEEIIEANKTVLAEIKVKKKDKHEVLSFEKIGSVIIGCKKNDGDIYDQAACLIRGLTKAHAFGSGNRRTAYLVGEMFLVKNGEKLKDRNPQEVISMLKKVREGRIRDADFKIWLEGVERNVKK